MKSHFKKIKTQIVFTKGNDVFLKRNNKISNCTENSGNAMWDTVQFKWISTKNTI